MALAFCIKDKKNDRVLVVEDFEKNRNGFRYPMMTKDSSMFFKLKGSKNTLVGVTDSYGELSTLKVNLKLQEGRDSVDYDYIVETMVPQIFEILDKYKFLKTKDGETTWNSTI